MKLSPPAHHQLTTRALSAALFVTTSLAPGTMMVMGHHWHFPTDNADLPPSLPSHNGHSPALGITKFSIFCENTAGSVVGCEDKNNKNNQYFAALP